MINASMHVTAQKQEALKLNEALLQEHEELQAFLAQETSRHHNAEQNNIAACLKLDKQNCVLRSLRCTQWAN